MKAIKATPVPFDALRGLRPTMPQCPWPWLHFSVVRGMSPISVYSDRRILVAIELSFERSSQFEALDALYPIQTKGRGWQRYWRRG